MLEVFLLSMLPISELRGAIPLGILMLDLDWRLVLPIGIMGNFIPAVLIVLGFNRVSRYLEKLPSGIKLQGWINNYFNKKAKLTRRIGLVGLVILVAIPLPFTGAWTGSLVASGLRLPVVKSLACILVGLGIAGGIVTGLCL